MTRSIPTPAPAPSHPTPSDNSDWINQQGNQFFWNFEDQMGCRIPGRLVLDGTQARAD
jgi:hypothetical protein